MSRWKNHSKFLTSLQYTTNTYKRILTLRKYKGEAFHSSGQVTNPFESTIVGTNLLDSPYDRFMVVSCWSVLTWSAYAFNIDATWGGYATGQSFDSFYHSTGTIRKVSTLLGAFPSVKSPWLSMKGSTIQCSSGIISRMDRKSDICLWSWDRKWCEFEAVQEPQQLSNWFFSLHLLLDPIHWIGWQIIVYSFVKDMEVTCF